MFNYTSIKRIFHSLLAVSLLTAVFCLPQPALADDPIPNPAAETYLLSELRSTGYADLSIFPEEERGVSGTTLLNALKDTEVLSKPLIFILNARVTDDLYASDLIIPANLVFSSVEFAGSAYFFSAQLQSFEAYDSTFMGDIDVSGASISRQMQLTNNDITGSIYFNDSTLERNANITGNTIGGTIDFGSSVIGGDTNIGDNTLTGSLSFLRATLNGNVDLRDNVISESLNFYGSHISGELLFDKSQVLGTEAMPGTSSPTEFWNATVDGLASFTGAYFKGYADFTGAYFKGLGMSGATFDGVADFTNLHTASDANFQGATFNTTAIFDNATTKRDANFQGATFNGNATFNYFTAERFVDFTNVTFNQGFNFYYTTVAYPYFENTVFNGPVTFEGMQASQAFELINTTYNYSDEPFPVTLAEVGGAVNFTNFTAPAGLLLSDNHFGSLSITTQDNPEIASIDLRGTDIDSDLLIDNVNMKTLLAEGVIVGASTTLYHVSITNNLDLRNADIGFLKVDENFKAPNNPEAFNLRGMTYSDIDLGNQGLTEQTWQGLLLLINQSAYSPQAYQALAQFLTDKGHSDWAAEVELQQLIRERDEIITPLSGSWFWSWFLYIFAGYGYRPTFAFIWSGLVIAIGAFIFRRKEDMLPVEQGDVQVEYNPIWYSFALFLPYIDLGIARKWEPNPEKKWARNYKYIHMILGWVLAPIALLAFSGVL